MKPVYRQVKALVEHCPECGDRLSGNNSTLCPWKCSCGTWESVKHPFTGEYEIKEEPQIGSVWRVKCLAIGRYIGKGKALFVSAMDNNLVVDDIVKRDKNELDLPLPSDADVEEYRKKV